MIAFGVIFLALDIYAIKNLKLLIPFIFIISIAAVFSVTLHYFGLMGGGDAKIIIGLGAMFPLLPDGNFVFPVFFLSAFTNAIFISFLLPLWFFISNIRLLPDVKFPREVLRLFVARKKNAKDVGKFEAVLDEGRFFMGTKNVEFGGGTREGEVWAAPALPFVVFLTIGFVVSITYGDLTYLFFRS
jgi:preflagellin peptidase FlaK